MFLFYNELTEGLVAPGMIRTPIRAGMVKTGCGLDEITHIEELSIRGAAMAARKAGVSLYADGLNQVARQLDLISEEGLEPARIVIAGCDDGRAIDLARDRELAAKGVTIAYDHVGWEENGVTDEQRADLVKGMVDAGFTSQVVLSSGAIGCPLGVTPSSHGFAHLLENFLPRLKAAGLGDSAIDTILVVNPKRILTPGRAEDG